MKTLLIPLAAFAVTVTSASAFSPDLLKRAGLNDEQIAAFEEAKELKEAGNKEAARDVLLAAGVDEDVIRQVREAMREHKSAILAAIDDKDYEAFLAAIDGSAFADFIDSEEEFDRLVEAYRLMQAGDPEGAKDIFEELGLTGPYLMTKLKEHREKHRAPFLDRLNREERQEFQAAMRDGDRERVRAIMEEAGVEARHDRGFGRWHKEHKQND